MNKTFSRVIASALALSVTAAYTPLKPIITAYAESERELDVDSSCIALYARKSIELNEKSVKVNGGIYSGDSLNYSGNSDKLSVSGTKASKGQGFSCGLPDYAELINAAEPYDFEFPEDKVIADPVLDLTLSSVYSAENLSISHAAIKGSGRISAAGDIDMSIADNSELTQAIIMSEEGDITIDAANLDFKGIIYAPNGTVKINAKDISLVGGIYADSIEINGTAVSVQYKDLLEIKCQAHTEKVVYARKGQEVTLSGTVSNQAADLLYSVPDFQKSSVTVTDEKTLSPKLTFSETGEYRVTLTASAANKQSSDTVNVIVTNGPVVNYTSTADFSAGSASSADYSGDELKLGKKSDSGEVSKDYSLNAPNGIRVKSIQNKPSVNRNGDDLDLDFELTGYGQLVTGNGNDVVLCIDNSGSVWSMIPTIKAAALQIIDSMGPNDRLGIVSLDNVYVPLTDNKEELIAAIDRYALSGGSDYGNGLRVINEQVFDEDSANRDKFVFLLADGENFGNDDEVAIEQAGIFKENGTKVYTFEINPFSSNFTDTSTVQDVAIMTGGAYKLCPDADAITKFLLNMADTIYSLAARNVTFTTTVKDASWVKNGTMKKAPASTVYNDDGSVTLSWEYSAFEIGITDDIGLQLKTGLISDNGYIQVTSDTKLISYDSGGNGSVLYLDDIIVGSDSSTDSGKWTSKVFDSGVDNCQWSYAEWTADYSGDSSMDIYLSTSSDGVNFSERTRITNGQKLSLSGRYIRTEVEMKASHDGSTPVLYDLTVYSDEWESYDLRQSADVRIEGAHTVSAGASVSLWLDIDGKYDSVSDIKWDLGDAKLLSDGKDPLKRSVSFEKEGEYTVSASVTAGGITTETTAKITVLPKKTLWQEFEEEDYKAVKMTVTDTPEYAVQYSEPLAFNLQFDNPDNVAWVRVLYHYSNQAEGTYQIAYVDEANDYLVTVPLNSGNLISTDILIEAYDWYGSKLSEERSVIMDRQLPNVYLNADRNWVYPNNDIIVKATATDNDEVAKLVLTCNDVEVPIDEEGQYVFSRPTAGDYVLKLEAADKAGNVNSTTRTVQVRADSGLPYVRIGGSSRMIIGNSNPLTMTAYDNETGLSKLTFTVQKDGEEDVKEIFSYDSKNGEIERESSYTFTPDEIGTYIFTLTATDKEGNVNPYTFKENVVADTIAPNITIGLSRAEVLAGDFTDVSIKVTDDVKVADYKFYIDDVETKLSADDTFHYISDDSNLNQYGYKNVIFKVVATDTSGNERTASRTLKVEADDTVLPSVGISASNRYEYMSTNAVVTVSASDNIGVRSVEATLNGEPVVLDENGKFTLDTSVITEYTVRAVATDTSGNVRETERVITVSDTTRPVINITADKSYYDTYESPVLNVAVTDNYKLDTVSATLDGNPVDVASPEFSVTVNEAEAGTHVLAVSAADSFGNTQERTYNITVRDTVKPELSASADKEVYAKGEIPEISCTFSDNVAVTRITADMNGTALTADLESGKILVPSETEPGEKTVTIRAYDAAGNASEPVVLTFFISASSDTECPDIESITVSPEIIRVGNEVVLTVKATDNSGETILTVTKDGVPVAEDAVSGVFRFTPDKTGDIAVTVKAEDPSGNYVVKEAVLTVYRNTENRKVRVDAPSVVNPNEQFSIGISSADGVPFDAAELWLGTSDVTSSLVKNSDGNFTAQLALPSNGTYTFKAVGKDADGYSAETIFSVQAASAYDSEIQSEEMQKALKQTSETQLSDELKELVKTFDSPDDAYEYVYNNIAFEAYTNSRRGAEGTYELKRGNDFDQASLLIGMLREMGYPARYAKGTAVIPSDLTMSLMTMEDFKSATDMLASSGKTAVILNRTDGTKDVKLDETFVQVYVPASETGETDETLKNLGVWVNLDASIKPSTHEKAEIEAPSQETVDVPALREQLKGTEYGELLDLLDEKTEFLDGAANSNLVESFMNGGVTVKDEGTYAHGRSIVQQEYNKLPASLNYELADDKIAVFNEIPVQYADTVQFAASNSLSGKNLGTYKVSDIYNKRMTLRFNGNTGDGTIFDMSKNAIYNNTFLPAIYIDGEIASQYSLSEHEEELEDYMIDASDEYYFFGNGAWRLGEHCTLTTQIRTNGRTTQWSDDIVIGSTHAIVLDVGGITENQFMDSVKAAAEGNGLDITDPEHPVATEKAKTGSKIYYDESAIGAYLDFAGKYYFLNCDAYTACSASFSNVEAGTDTKLLMTGYSIGSLEDTVTGNTTRVIPGRFEIDVAYNSGFAFSRSGDRDARNDYMFNAAYMESYYEGNIWERLLGSDGVSTVSVLNKAMDNGGKLVCINSENADTELARVDLTSQEKSDIQSYLSSGYSIIIPDKRTTMNKWSGTGYIIADFEGYNQFVFKISGGLNGGSGTEEVDLAKNDLLEALGNVDTDQAFADLFSIAQSLFYVLLTYNVGYEFGPATEALAAASGCGPVGVFIGGVALYGAAKHLVDIVNYRTEMLDIFYDYCMADEPVDQGQAFIDMLVLVIKETKDLFDTAKSFLTPEGDEDEKFLDAVKEMIDAFIEIIENDLEEDDGGHDGLADVAEDHYKSHIKDLFWDAVTSD